MRTLLLIGRFQPFHNGHLELCKRAAEQCDLLVVGLGSCNLRASKKNPFSVSQREEMVHASLGPICIKPAIIHLYDYPEDDNAWAERVRQTMLQFGDWALFGHSKDSSSFYLKLFPERELVTYDGPVMPIDATYVRELFFDRPPHLAKIKEIVPNGTYEALMDHYKGERWQLAATEGTYL